MEDSFKVPGDTERIPITMVPQRSKEYMNFEKCPQISENKLQWHYFICVCR